MNSVGTGEQFQRPTWVCTKAVPSTRSCVRAYPRAFCSGVPSSVTQRHTHGESEGMVHHSDRSADGAPVCIARSPPETVDGMYCSSARAVERLIVLELCHAALSKRAGITMHVGALESAETAVSVSLPIKSGRQAPARSARVHTVKIPSPYRRRRYRCVNVVTTTTQQPQRNTHHVQETGHPKIGFGSTTKCTCPDPA